MKFTYYSLANGTLIEGHIKQLITLTSDNIKRLSMFIKKQMLETFFADGQKAGSVTIASTQQEARHFDNVTVDKRFVEKEGQQQKVR